MLTIPDTFTANITIFLAALVILLISAERAVRSVLKILHHYGFSATFGGLTIFSISTSFPEIFSHIVASIGILGGTLDTNIASATVLGANIGSDVIQQTLILGIVVMLMGGMIFEKSFLMTAYIPMILASLLTLILGWDGTFSRLDGLILLLTFIAYMVFLYKREETNEKVKKIKTKIGKQVVIMFLSFIGLIVGANFLLQSSEKIVMITGLGASLIGVVSIGVVSAAPEFFTAIYGVRHKAVGISLGTLIGSNITNPLFGIGIGALISKYIVPKALVIWDLPMAVVTASLLLIYLFLRKGKLGRPGAVYLILLYIAYLAIRITFFAHD